MDTVIQTTGLTKKYGPTTALDQLDIVIQKGEVIGYLGPNGAGKTTTIRLLLGLIKSTSGQAQIFGLDAYKAAAQIHKDIAYVPGEANLWPNLTGAETLRFLANIHGTIDKVYEQELIKKYAVIQKATVKRSF